MEDDEQFMALAVEEAAKSKPESGKPHPKVGAVVVRDGKEVGRAHRGELGAGDHAEYTVLEKKLAAEQLAGSTVYTTLEPCTKRNNPKVACADRLVERRVARVVIGMLDPNPVISGKGLRRLREAGIRVDMFLPKYGAMVEEQNRDFSRQFSTTADGKAPDASRLEQLQSRNLDNLYRDLNRIYWNRNFYKDEFSIFTHLVEVVGGLSFLASSKAKKGVTGPEYVAKALAWWMALCGKVGVKSVSDMLWAKFPGACPYCIMRPHQEDECKEQKANHPGPRWEELTNEGTKRRQERPSTLGDWQKMFFAIYPVSQTEDFGPTFGRLTEELGELAETLRVFPAAPGYFLSEASDVFAWLMRIQNIIDSKSNIPRQNRGQTLDRAFSVAYPGRCHDCGGDTCSCPPILASTVGRITHEVPAERGSYGPNGNFMTADLAAKVFQEPDR